MQDTTIEILKSVLKSDTSVQPEERERLLSIFKAGPRPASPGEKLLKRKQVAEMLSSSCRLVDKLAEEGQLHKVRYKGRVRAAGYRLSEVQAILADGMKETVYAQ